MIAAPEELKIDQGKGFIDIKKIVAGIVKQFRANCIISFCETICAKLMQVL